MRFFRRLARFVGGALVLLAIPAVAAGLLVLAFGELQDEQGPVVDDLPLIDEAVPIGSADLRDSSPVDLSLKWEQGPPVPAPAITGLVTGVNIIPGQALRSGEWLLEVDGIQRVGYATERPLWQPVSRSSSEAEVRVLVDLLIEMGYELEPTDVYSSTVRRVVRQFHTDAGAPRTSTFDPSMAVWLGEALLQDVETVEIAVGEPMPGAGEPLLRGRSELLSAKVQVGDSGEGGTGTRAIAGERVFVVDGNEFAFDHDQRQVPSSDLAALSELIDPSVSSLSGLVQLASPLEVQTVPVSAVVVADSGSTCVVLASSNGDDPTAGLRNVTIVASDGGVAQIEPTLESSDRVLATMSEATRTEATNQCS